jgi:uncharacterized protein YcfJ
VRIFYTKPQQTNNAKKSKCQESESDKKAISNTEAITHKSQHTLQYSSTYKINANGGNVRLGVRVVGESEQQTRLSDTGISNEKEFKEIIAVWLQQKKMP